MLPYGSLAVGPSNLPANITFGGLAEVMDSLREREMREYKEKALAAVRELAGMTACKFRLDPALSNYSLKFSKSANMWTAYCFAYHLSTEGSMAEPSVKATWLSLDDLAITRALDVKQIDGFPIADNVLALLRNTQALAVLR